MMTYMFHILCWHGNMVVLLSETPALPCKKKMHSGTYLDQRIIGKSWRLQTHPI